MKIQIPISYKVVVFGLLALGAIIYPNRTKAEWPDFDNFFHAKIDLIDIGKHPNLHDYANRQTDQVSYYMARWSEHDSVKGYAYLGYSSLEESGPYAGYSQKPAMIKERTAFS